MSLKAVRSTAKSVSIGPWHPMETPWRWLTFKHGRINTHFLQINSGVRGPPLAWTPPQGSLLLWPCQHNLRRLSWLWRSRLQWQSLGRRREGQRKAKCRWIESPPLAWMEFKDAVSLLTLTVRETRATAFSPERWKAATCRISNRLPTSQIGRWDKSKSNSLQSQEERRQMKQQGKFFLTNHFLNDGWSNVSMITNILNSIKRLRLGE